MHKSSEELLFLGKSELNQITILKVLGWFPSLSVPEEGVYKGEKCGGSDSLTFQCLSAGKKEIYLWRK